jgi:hypothetical protein
MAQTHIDRSTCGKLTYAKFTCAKLACAKLACAKLACGKFTHVPNSRVPNSHGPNHNGLRSSTPPRQIATLHFQGLLWMTVSAEPPAELAAAGFDFRTGGVDRVIPDPGRFSFRLRLRRAPDRMDERTPADGRGQFPVFISGQKSHVCAYIPGHETPLLTFSRAGYTKSNLWFHARVLFTYYELYIC